MIKITVNDTLKMITGRVIPLLLVSAGLSACGPIALPRMPMQPQVVQNYPAQPQMAQVVRQQQPIQRQAATAQRIPEAGALTSAPVVVARAPVPVQPQAVRQAAVVQRQAYQPVAQISVPPAINPVQPARIPNVSTGYQSRPSASVMRAPAAPQSRQPIWENQPQQVAPARKRTVQIRRPSASVRKPAKTTVQKVRPVVKPAPQIKQARPAPRPVKPATRPSSVKQAQESVTGTQNVSKPQVEVLDMRSSTTQNTQQAQVKPVIATPPTPRSYSDSPAVAVLTKQANNQLTAGKADRAAATLERALRIDPDNPMLWLRLAEANSRQGRKSQAASMARKAMNLAPDDAGLQARGRRLLN